MIHVFIYMIKRSALKDRYENTVKKKQKEKQVPAKRFSFGIIIATSANTQNSVTIL